MNEEAQELENLFNEVFGVDDEEEMFDVIEAQEVTELERPTTMIVENNYGAYKLTVGGSDQNIYELRDKLLIPMLHLMTYGNATIGELFNLPDDYEYPVIREDM